MSGYIVSFQARNSQVVFYLANSLETMERSEAKLYKTWKGATDAIYALQEYYPIGEWTIKLTNEVK